MLSRRRFWSRCAGRKRPFSRYRRYETYFELLMKNRLEEEHQPQGKKTSENTVDPIFLGNDGKPVQFVNEKSEFEVGRIADAERKKLPPDYLEAVEQLLIWMRDPRLLWLLGEVLNASAMDQKQESAKEQAIRNAFEVFKQLKLDEFNGKEIAGRDKIRQRYEILEPQVKPAFVLNPNLLPDKDAERVIPTSLLSNELWWRALSVGFVVGFAVGIFAVLQFQEARRRRQAR